MTSEHRKPNTYIRMVLTAEDGSEYANQKYTLEVDGVKYPGITDSRGLLEKEIPENSKHGKLILQRDDGSMQEAVELLLDIVEG